MTLANTSIVNSYVGTGAVNVYPFTFVAFNAVDLSIIVTSPAASNIALALGTDYTVSGLNPTGGPPSTGNITLVNSGQAWLTGGFLTAGWTITITRIVALEQPTSIRNQGDFYQETLEDALDYTMMAIQQLEVAIQQLVPVPNVTTGTQTFTSDIIILGAGKGLILTTPDGTKTVRIAVDNNLVITRQEQT